MSIRKPIILLTDFGRPYTAIMEGVIKSISPDAEIIGLYDEVEPQSVIQASFLLSAVYHHFPLHSIFVCVIDPGVGSKRDIILTQSHGYSFLAPDNGLLSGIISKESACSHTEVTNKDYFLKEISNVFHGRDIFAPVAAHLSNGLDPSELGRARKTIKSLELDKPSFAKGEINGSVVFSDRFGNMITNIPSDMLAGHGEIEIIAGDSNITKIYSCYAEGRPHVLQAFISSFGYLELSIPMGNARHSFPELQKVKIILH